MTAGACPLVWGHLGKNPGSMTPAVNDESGVPTRTKVSFRPAARLQVVLAEQLVADPNVAVLEFVKNAYDAGAHTCLVHFELGARPVDGRLVIADDGSGMDLDGLKANFMRPGFSEKAEREVPSGGRVPVGEKGLGRLAAGRLGEQLDLYTRPTADEPWLHLGFRWSDFDDMHVPLDQVSFYVDEDQAPPEAIGDRGTVIVISRLRMRWDARVPGRKVKGRATTRLGRLRQDLELLLPPLTAADAAFAITLDHNSSLPEDVKGGPVVPPALQLLDYQFDFVVDRDGEGWKVMRTLRRSPALADRLDRPEEETADEIDAEQLLAGNMSDPPSLGDLGPFDATIYFAPENGAALAQIGAPVGVRLYRDGVRIDPYGEPGDDWLSIGAHKASRQGHAALDPKAVYGAVRIGRSANPNLRPLANREGLVDNDEFEAFLLVLRAQVRWFNDQVQEEYVVPPRDERRRVREGDERQAAALTAQRYAVGISRSAVHALRQPVAAVGNELSLLRREIERTPMADELRQRLQELHDRALEHLERADEAADSMMRRLNFDPTPREVDLAAVVREGLLAARPSADAAGILLVNEMSSTAVELDLPGGLVELALEELLANAIRVPRPAGRRGVVTVRLEGGGQDLRLIVCDDGEGVAEPVRKRLFAETVSTAGHIGFGLFFTRQLLALARGGLELVETGTDGTCFAIILPA